LPGRQTPAIMNQVRPSRGRTIGTAVLIGLVVVLTAFLITAAGWDSSPRETLRRLTGGSARKVLAPKSTAISSENYGILARLDQAGSNNRMLPVPDLRAALKEVLGVSPVPVIDEEVWASRFETVERIPVRAGVSCELARFESYDGLRVPVYILRPAEFSENRKYPAVLLFSGHGSAAQAAYEADSYQRGAGVELAAHGFVVFVMENRGMGRLRYLGDHLRIDAVARLTGGSWYGELETDALVLLEAVRHEGWVDEQKIGAAGVSTGGALSMFTAALDERVVAAYVQGFLGSFRTTFGKKADHCLCGHIPGILEVADMAAIAAWITPRPVCFVNGSEDVFIPDDARTAFEQIRQAYAAQQVEENAVLVTPNGVGHELTVNLLLPWFEEHLR